MVLESLKFPDTEGSIAFPIAFIISQQLEQKGHQVNDSSPRNGDTNSQSTRRKNISSEGRSDEKNRIRG